MQGPRGSEQISRLLAQFDGRLEGLARRAHVATGRPGPGSGLEHLHLVLHVGGESQGVEGGERLVGFGRRPGQCQGMGGQRFAPAGADRQREVEEDRSGAGRLQECGLHPALLQAERSERSGDDRALLRALVHRQLLLRRGQQVLGFAEPTEPDQGEGMVPERAPGLGKDRRALADGCTGGRDEEGQSLVHAAGTGQAPAQQGVQAGARSTDRPPGAAPRRR